jgi:hypothetical protein
LRRGRGKEVEDDETVSRTAEDVPRLSAEALKVDNIHRPGRCGHTGSQLSQYVQIHDIPNCTKVERCNLRTGIVESCGLKPSV